jgi:hypothetical protein
MCRLLLHHVPLHVNDVVDVAHVFAIIYVVVVYVVCK